MKKISSSFVLLALLFTLSCDNDNEPGFVFENINGFVQKGPYLNGTSITISELTSDLTSTGKNFTSQILDNKGNFEIKNVELTSQYVELKADGFYFNEVLNENSSAQLTLFAISDISNKSSLNVNILSNIEKSRVSYLVSNGIRFSDAKNQAQKEILSIFEINREDILESEQLDITKSGDDHAILLAVSVILQGYLSVPDLSELLANMSTDIREDGVLNSQSIGSTLINNAKTIQLDAIRQNLESRYEEMGLNITIPDFEKYVNQFIENTDFVFTGFIAYPQNGAYGTNLLDKNRTEYSAGYHSLNAILPNGTSLKVKIQGKNWFYPVSQDWSGWEKSDWNDADNSRTFTSKKTGEIDLKIRLEADTTSAMIKIYVHENGDIEPTWTKEI
ncbi:MAG: hypothetical protein A2W90_00450 [Bacteroidetes bacterium GWF2_42_66]|nr:MAG: hypothetical protein A2W92_18865 [Bacteroidetes bacterium GWA2_42_15]OFY02093.1 MAG: hypothetical protein A2W89_11635 [Bacteroidetes bacterium GWE2_42_39]OFY43440.1 MAG: hypothetical protein A2W90_00450 [Bacteroidetes bacterium GWF2_42_66]HBL76525.1 hypothetical protein [Prolixibacteraceae bacterium]HCR92263.1 hypothetical protein [Prolixibacteraceae bacterium]